MRRLATFILACTGLCFSVKAAPAVQFGPAVQMRASDVTIPAPSPNVQHVTMDVYVDVPQGPIDVSVFGMLFDISPSGAAVTITNATEPSPARTPIFPLADLFISFSAPAASGHDAAAVGLYAAAGNVSRPAGSYGLFTLALDIAPNTVGTFDLVFDTNPTFTGLAGSLPGNDLIIYPNADAPPVGLAQVTVLPEPSAAWLAVMGAAALAGSVLLGSAQAARRRHPCTVPRPRAAQ
jgi:hypothetical protein